MDGACDVIVKTLYYSRLHFQPILRCITLRYLLLEIALDMNTQIREKNDKTGLRSANDFLGAVTSTLLGSADDQPTSVESSSPHSC